MVDEKDGIKPKMTFTFGDETKPFKGWVQLVKEERVQTDAPWRKGSLLKIDNSPAPAKVPHDSVVMFLDHKLVKYRITVPEIKEGNSPGFKNDSKETDHLQHRITVLFDEKIVELFSERIGDFYEVEE